MDETREAVWQALDFLFKSHPWHGVPIGPDAPRVVTTYVEIVPTDTVKYELDKVTGILRVDRPQMYSNVCPSPYGLVPRTLCAEDVGRFCSERTGRPGIVGDGDPMDICVLTEKDLSHGNILVQAIPIGGLRMLDGNEADDKIIAVLHGDALYGGWRDISECPPALVDRLRHYFLTYKQAPDRHTGLRDHAHLWARRGPRGDSPEPGGLPDALLGSRGEPSGGASGCGLAASHGRAIERTSHVRLIWLCGHSLSTAFPSAAKLRLTVSPFASTRVRTWRPGGGAMAIWWMLRVSP